MNPPQRPQLAASAAIFRDRLLLVVRRAREPGAGRWSLPGGRVEWGETLQQAVTREVTEETGIAITLLQLAGTREVLPNIGRGHFVVLSYAATWQSGEVVLNDEHDAFRWVTPDELGVLETTDGLLPIIAAARRIVGV
jgi:8-oxo-dGTP diphosphatase